jgi:hypothetical protein
MTSDIMTSVRPFDRRLRSTPIVALACMALLASCVDKITLPTPTRAELPINAIAQQTEVWCWAASAEMILAYYHEPNLNPAGNYQCGVVGAYWYVVGGANHPCVSNCFLCETGASSTFEIQRILTEYGNVARFFGISARVLSSQSRFGQLSLPEIANELDNGRPILAGVSFPGQPTLPGISGHAVVFSGYDATGTVPTITVRDPYPYEAFIPANQNPYLKAGGVYVGPGTYRIALSALSGGNITWGNSIFGIQ